ncbi:unnamed protein product [Spodoptera exigua]|nr:unnamed protein product [Spodoptera exigua]
MAGGDSPTHRPGPREWLLVIATEGQRKYLANTDSAMLGGEGMGSLQTEQRSLEIQEYRRNYFSIVVAAILARARRESDDTDDITEAAARCHISDQPITAPEAQLRCSSGGAVMEPLLAVHHDTFSGCSGDRSSRGSGGDYGSGMTDGVGRRIDVGDGGGGKKPTFGPGFGGGGVSFAPKPEIGPVVCQPPHILRSAAADPRTALPIIKVAGSLGSRPGWFGDHHVSSPTLEGPQRGTAQFREITVAGVYFSANGNFADFHNTGTMNSDESFNNRKQKLSNIIKKITESQLLKTQGDPNARSLRQDCSFGMTTKVRDSEANKGIPMSHLNDKEMTHVAGSSSSRLDLPGPSSEDAACMPPPPPPGPLGSTQTRL